MAITDIYNSINFVKGWKITAVAINNQSANTTDLDPCYHDNIATSICPQHKSGTKASIEQ